MGVRCIIAEEEKEGRERRKASLLAAKPNRLQ